MGEQGGASAGPRRVPAKKVTAQGDLPTDGRANADTAHGRRLPVSQPQRALVVCLAYLGVVAAAFVVLSQLYRPAMAIFFSVALAMILTVPLAVLAPLPRGERSHPDSARPVLHRGSRPPKR